MNSYTFSITLRDGLPIEMTYTERNYATALSKCALDISECSYADKVTRISEVSQPMAIPAEYSATDLAVAILEAQTGFRK